MRGGKRQGSGRKVNPAKVLSVGADSALRVLKEIKHEKALKELWDTCGDARLKTYIVFRLMEFGFGRPAQTHHVDGNLTLDLTARRERIRELISRLAGKAGSGGS